MSLPIYFVPPIGFDRVLVGQKISMWTCKVSRFMPRSREGVVTMTTLTTSHTHKSTMKTIVERDRGGHMTSHVSTRKSSLNQTMPEVSHQLAPLVRNYAKLILIPCMLPYKLLLCVITTVGPVGLTFSTARVIMYIVCELNLRIDPAYSIFAAVGV